jgi:hypothetical protein
MSAVFPFRKRKKNRVSLEKKPPKDFGFLVLALSMGRLAARRNLDYCANLVTILSPKARR